ncbi:MAG: hypothetical protein IKH11_06615 [Bacteroidales bacterium]|nr:hypothetical protein [Bacteroidales bacterium]
MNNRKMTTEHNYTAPDTVTLESFPESLLCDSPASGNNELIEYEEWAL